MHKQTPKLVKTLKKAKTGLFFNEKTHTHTQQARSQDFVKEGGQSDAGPMYLLPKN